MRTKLEAWLILFKDKAWMTNKDNRQAIAVIEKLKETLEIVAEDTIDARVLNKSKEALAIDPEQL